MSKARRSLLIVAVLASLLGASLTPISQAQILSGRLVINTDYELYGVGNLDGGGHISWTLYDEQASHLREKIVNMFDRYSQIPPGFPCEGSPTQSTPNSKIDSTEALSYTDRLENVIEDSCAQYVGTKDRYLTITKADLAEKQMPVERSTEGLVESVASSTSLLRIRFIFNAGTSVGSERFHLGESTLPDALHKVFDFDEQSFFYWDGTQYLMAPLRSLDGWRTVWVGDERAFTPSYAADPSQGNASESYWGFTPNTWNSSEVQPTYSVSTLRGTFFSKNWTDLTFADKAYVRVKYMGSRVDDADKLRLQIATNNTNFTDWTNLADETGADYFQNRVWLDWNEVRFPLDNYLGKIVRLRLNFTSDAINTPAPGYFISDFEIKGESRYHGLVEYGSTSYVVSTTSFSDFAIGKGSANVIRTPAGEILLYGISYNTEDGVPFDSIEYRGFDFFENPQISFAVTLAAAYLIAYYQTRYFNQFKAAHPMQYRPAAGKIKWLHWLGRILIILLVVFYFLPGLFAFAAPSFLIGGPAMWFLSFFFVIGIALLSKFLYMRQAKYIPPEAEGAAPGVLGVMEIPPPPGAPAPTQFCADCLNVIESPANSYTCECGKVYHKLCASELKECPECHRKITVELPTEKLVTAQCPTCREIQHLKEGADLSRTKCTKCDTVLRALDEGLNYLVIDKDPGTSYQWFLGLARRERPSLCMTTTFPEKIVKEYHLEQVELYWLSDTNPGPKTLDPKRLDFEVIRAISNFAKNFKGGAMLLDGLEYVVVENGFDKTYKFIKRVNDLCSVHGMTFIVPITPGALGPDELTMLRKEFDRVEELVAPPPPPPPKKR